MVAATATDLLLHDPTADELLEPALFMPAETPVSGGDADGVPVELPSEDSIELSATTSSCCGSGGQVSVGSLTVGVHEESPTVKGYFRFSTMCATACCSAVTVYYTLSGTASAGADYSGPLTAGSVTIPIVNHGGSVDVWFKSVEDTGVEGDESIIVTIEDRPQYFVGQRTASSWVFDNDPCMVSLFMGPDHVVEGPGVYFELVVRRSANLTLSLSVPLNAGGSASSSDYTGLPTSVGFSPGESEKTYRIDVVDDTTPEWTESLTVSLGSGGGAFVPDPAANSATVEIVDTDIYLTAPDRLQVNNDDDNGNGVSDRDETSAVTGEDDLARIGLDYPRDVKVGATVGFSATGPVKVFTGSDRTGAFTSSSRSWVVGQNTIPTELWVEAIGGSSTVGDIGFTLIASDATAVQAPEHPTYSVVQKNATAVGISIIRGGQDITGKTANVLIGEMIDMYVSVQAPSAWQQNPAYQWTVPGSVLREYMISPDDSAARVVPLGDAHGGTDHEVLNGRKQSKLTYFWIATTAAPPGPDTNAVSISVGNVGPQGQGAAYGAKTTFSLYSPTSQASRSIGTAGMDAARTKIGLFQGDAFGTGISFVSRVDLPAGLNFAQGEWHYVQKFRPDRRVIDNDNTSFHRANNLVWGLDNQHPKLPVANDPYTTAGPGWPTGGAHIAIDEPTMPLNATLKRVSMDDYFVTFLMFRPAGNSRWVPLQKVDWHVRVVAAKGQNGWALDGQPSQSAGQFVPTVEVPMWDVVHVSPGTFEPD
jgi:hypothetical protein